MAITRSYNRHTNTYYAYETQYVFDEMKQKKVMRRHCIGKFDSDGNIIPNGKRGRRKTPFPVLDKEKAADTSSQMPSDSSAPVTDAPDFRKQTIDSAVTITLSLANELATDVGAIKSMMSNLHSRLLETENKLSAVSAMLDDLSDNGSESENPYSGHKS